MTSLPVLLAGVAGGVAANVAMILTFRLVGFGWNGGGVLLDPSLQSAKLIAVWTTLEPLPLVIAQPAIIAAGLLVLAVAHAAFYRWLSPAWPQGIAARGWRFALLLYVFPYLFWEFFTPFNQFGEPLPLIALELAFWGCVAAAEAFAIAAIMEARRRGEGESWIAIRRST